MLFHIVEQLFRNCTAGVGMLRLAALCDNRVDKCDNRPCSRSCAAKMASSIFSSGSFIRTGFDHNNLLTGGGNSQLPDPRPASEHEVGLIIPTRRLPGLPVSLPKSGRQTEYRKLQVAMEEPIMATTSGLHSGSTLITVLVIVTSLR